MLRGSAIRVTGLGPKGEVNQPIPYAVSKSITKVSVDEVTVAGNSEVLDTPEQERRVQFHRLAQTVRYKVGIDFIRVDPGMLSLVAGVRLVYGHGAGFGEIPFGIAPFGGGLDTTPVIGFDSGTRLPVASFAMEVWSKLDQAAAQPTPLGFDELPFDETPFDLGVSGGGLVSNPCSARRWGYTLFPYLKGGYLSGFTFENGLLSFSLKGAQTRRMSRWGVGPYDLEGPNQRLLSPVSRNTHFRTFITTAQPPAEQCGTLESIDVIDNGTAANPMPDPTAATIVDGGHAETSPAIIDGGRAT